MRIQKYLSERGILSRRKAEEYIRASKVLVNGKPAAIGQSVDPAKDKVLVQGATSFEATILHKPRGLVSSRSSREGRTVFEAYPELKRFHLAGRLDKESEGLLLFTNDGVLARRITGDEHLIEKEYEVHVRESIVPAQLSRMERGISLPGGTTLPARARKTGDHTFTLVLKEGRKHQIRRMCDAVRLTITRLIRTRIGSVTLKGLGDGEVRPLTEAEMSSFKKLQF